MMTDAAANDIVADFVRSKIRETVNDPAVASVLTPRGYPIGAKRLPADSDYYATYNRDNLSIVDLRSEPIEEITPSGIRTRDREYDLDIIVFATGFDAITGALLKMDIRGKKGTRLADRWANGPLTYLGIMSAGFPNLFMITGPNSPALFSNVVVSIEQHVEWIRDCLDYMKKNHMVQIEADPEAEIQWVEHVKELADHSLFPRADSYYMGANIPGKPRVFTLYAGGVAAYRKKCDEIVANGYEGFKFAIEAVIATSGGRMTPGV
jgi:cyclohexanone monooxygenase